MKLSSLTAMVAVALLAGQYLPASAQEQKEGVVTAPVPTLPSILKLRVRPEGTTLQADIDLTLSEEGETRTGTIFMNKKGRDGCTLAGTPIVAEKKVANWLVATMPRNNLECKTTYILNWSSKGWEGTYQAASNKGSVEPR